MTAQAVETTSLSTAAPALVNPGRMRMANAYHSGAQSMESQFAASLRQDVARHPKDFIIFDTRVAAYHFLRDHPSDATRETEPRMVDSGVLGYWQGKTLVVLPLVSSMTDGAQAGTVHDKN